MSNETIRLSVTGMSCGHCAASTEKALKAVDGVEQVSVNLESGEAIVTGHANIETLIAAVIEAGFEAKQA